MRRRKADSADLVLGAYAGLGARARLHTHLRWHSAPLRAVAALAMPTGTVLDLGCGHGLMSLLLAAGEPGRIVHGVDIDPDKVDLARRAAERAGLSDRTTFEVVPPGWYPPPSSYDNIFLIDVLYLQGLEEATALLVGSIEAVAPGGRLVIKEMGDRPAWKATVNRLQELISVRLLSITAGSTVEMVPVALIEAIVLRSGVAVQRIDLHRRHLHPHVAIVGDRLSV